MKKRVSLFLSLLAAFFLLPACSPTTPAQSITAESALPVSSDLKLYCFQAGKADAFLFWNESCAVLIDTGESGYGKTILQKLDELGIKRLDALILTHFDKDHVGGAKKLVTSLEIGTIYQSNCPKTGAEAYEKYAAALAETGQTAITLRERVTFRLGDAAFTVDPPAAECYSDSPSNNSSLIVEVRHGRIRMLFCGDAEDARLTEYLRGSASTFDLVKLPHHGVWQTSLRALLAQTKPSCAIVTSSDEEPEEEQTTALLEESGVTVLLTRLGAFTVTSDGAALQVVSE